MAWEKDVEPIQQKNSLWPFRVSPPKEEIEMENQLMSWRLIQINGHERQSIYESRQTRGKRAALLFGPGLCRGVMQESLLIEMAVAFLTHVWEVARAQPGSCLARGLYHLQQLERSKGRFFAPLRDETFCSAYITMMETQRALLWLFLEEEKYDREMQKNLRQEELECASDVSPTLLKALGHLDLKEVESLSARSAEQLRQDIEVCSLCRGLWELWEKNSLV